MALLTHLAEMAIITTFLVTGIVVLAFLLTAMSDFFQIRARSQSQSKPQKPSKRIRRKHKRKPLRKRSK